MGFMLMYFLPVAFTGIVVYGSIWALQTMCADLLSSTSTIWWRWLCGGGITAIVIVYALMVKTVFVNRIWRPWKNRYLTKREVVRLPPNHGTMCEQEEW